MPSPRLPTVESKKNCETPALPKRTVDDALRPDFAKMIEEVAALMTPKLLSQVKGAAPVAEPQAEPVFDMSPIAENVAHPGVPPAEETMRLVVEARPVFDMEKSVEVAEAVDEPIAKRKLFDDVSPVFA